MQEDEREIDVYVFFNPHSHSHLFNKLIIHTTFMYAYTYPLFISIYSLTSSQAHSSNYAQLRNARTTEFPKEWFEGLNLKRQVTRSTYDKGVNKYGVKCGGDLHMWESSGWMSNIDPYGWFQWYCRFYLGRRSSDDARQISRGNRVAGPKGCLLYTSDAADE